MNLVGVVRLCPAHNNALQWMSKLSGLHLCAAKPPAHGIAEEDSWLSRSRRMALPIREQLNAVRESAANAPGRARLLVCAKWTAAAR
jgi:hypothetical protein